MFVFKESLDDNFGKSSFFEELSGFEPDKTIVYTPKKKMKNVSL